MTINTSKAPTNTARSIDDFEGGFGLSETRAVANAQHMATLGILAQASRSPKVQAATMGWLTTKKVVALAKFLGLADLTMEEGKPLSDEKVKNRVEQALRVLTSGKLNYPDTQADKIPHPLAGRPIYIAKAQLREKGEGIVSSGEKGQRPVFWHFSPTAALWEVEQDRMVDGQPVKLKVTQLDRLNVAPVEEEEEETIAPAPPVKARK